MIPVKHSNRGSTFLTIVIVVAFLGIVWVNFYIHRVIKRIPEAALIVPKTVSVRKTPALKTQKKQSPSGEVIRQIRQAPDGKTNLYIFYQDSQEIARQKVLGEKRFSVEGNIPDGRIKFIDQVTETYGVAYYWDNQLHGSSRTYYKDGSLHKEAYYQYDKLLTVDEYFSDGALRMKADYSDARTPGVYADVGEGKVYSGDGKSKYEWRVVNREKIGFMRSYNRDGSVRAEILYDEKGNEIPSKE